MFTWVTASCHNKNNLWPISSIYDWAASCGSALCKWCAIFKVIRHDWVMWFPRSFVWQGGAVEGIHQQRTLPFESMQRVSSVVKDWILGMDDWPRGQCELCRAERWPQGWEAERKWTWRSDQNIVWQGNKVKWSRLQFLWKVNQWGLCLNGNPPGYRVMGSL